MGPQFPRLRMQGGALHIAVAQREFLRLRTGATDEGIVGGHAAVVVQADHRTRVIIEHLRARLVTTVAEGQIDHAFAVKHDAAAEMLAGAGFRFHGEQDLHAGHSITVEFAARQCGAPATRAGGVVGPVDPAVLCVLRMKSDIEQATLAAGDDLGQAFDRFWIKLKILADNAQPPCALSHQHPAVGQEGH